MMAKGQWTNVGPLGADTGPTGLLLINYRQTILPLFFSLLIHTSSVIFSNIFIDGSSE